MDGRLRQDTQDRLRLKQHVDTQIHLLTRALCTTENQYIANTHKNINFKELILWLHNFSPLGIKGFDVDHN